MTHTPRTVKIADTARVVMKAGELGNEMVMEGVVRDEDIASAMTPLIDEMHRFAVTASLREVVLDLRRLEYANAAFWKCIVLWLKRIRQSAGVRYNLRLVASSEHRWQRIGVPALQIFGADRLVIEGINWTMPPPASVRGT